MNWLKYGGGYLGTLVAVLVLYYVIDAMIGGDTTTSVLMLTPVIAAIYPSSSFVKDHQRVPSSEERWQLVGLCFGVFLVAQAIQFGVAAAIWPDAVAELLDVVGGGTLAILVLVTLVVEFALMWLLFRFHPGRQLKGMRKAEARKAAQVR